MKSKLTSWLNNNSEEIAELKGKLQAIDKTQAVIEFNMDGTIITANDNFCKTLGYTLDEIQGKHHSLFVDESEKNSPEYRTFWETLNRGQFQSAEYKRVGKEGNDIWIQASYNPIFDNNNKPYKVVKFATDMTEQVASARFNDRTSAALDLSQANMMISDVNYNIIYISKTVEAMFKNRETAIQAALPQFNVNSIVGTNIDSFHVNPAHQRGMLDSLTSTYETDLELAGLTFGLIANPLLDADGNRIGTSVEWDDKTERLAAERKAQEIANANARSSSALQVCQANVMMADADLNIVYMNDAVREMLTEREKELQAILPNFVVKDLIGTCVDDFHANPAHQRGMLDKLVDTYTTDLVLGEMTFGLIATPVFNDNNERLGTVVEWEDKTERLAAERKAQEIANANARSSNALQVCQANVMMADEDLNIVYMNDAVRDMLTEREKELQAILPNFLVKDLIGTCVDDFHANPAHQRGMLEKLVDTYTTDLVLGDMTFGLIATPVFNDNNERLGTVVEWEDKTDRLAAEVIAQQLANENARQSSALKVCQANVMMADTDLNIIYMNDILIGMLKNREKALQQILPNFVVDNLIGTCVDDFHVNPAHQRGMISKLTDVYQTEIQLADMTFGLIATPVFNDLGERLGTAVEWTDRTDEVAIEKEIDTLVSSAVAGDLTKRIDTASKTGFFEALGLGLNKLVTVADDVVARTADVLEAMSHGDLTKSMDGEYEGSFAKLQNDTNLTVNKLTEIITEIRNSASSVASGAQEISGGNLDLSQRTEEQASSLEETAASMEEMTSSVRQSADNAKNASELATEAQKKAESGGEVVGRAVDAMEEINESSNKISDIIGVIDEIAFQTNLLALNAAVEAARAGEQGRGFAVVAAEVRNLAQRSAGAAKEIKELIRDSVGKVEDGSKLVNESGKTLGEIVQAVQQVSTIIREISSSSSEQSDGIDQVNTAVSQMDEATQQNAALVEEASAASENMAEQAGLMNELMDFFSTDGAKESAVVHSPVEAVNNNAKANTASPKKVIKSDDQGDGWEEF